MFRLLSLQCALSCAIVCIAFPMSVVGVDFNIVGGTKNIDSQKLRKEGSQVVMSMSIDAVGDVQHSVAESHFS